MRLNEDEPLVWRDERAKLRKWEVQRRARILEAGGRLKAKRERGWTLADKNETVRVKIESEHVGRMNFHTSKCGIL